MAVQHGGLPLKILKAHSKVTKTAILSFRSLYSEENIIMNIIFHFCPLDLTHCNDKRLTSHQKLISQLHSLCSPSHSSSLFTFIHPFCAFWSLITSRSGISHNFCDFQTEKVTLFPEAMRSSAGYSCKVTQQGDCELAAVWMCVAVWK